ncbi:tetratricopeptide repeat protein [Rhizorhabdus dicambivorans]|uniref:tetratricopeptide repeat protein n=1 Tax=Rhizorhabdus dicambivorans TaxID=1850238 RepID=UPI001EDDAD37|nr:tetratricopeptide repeat protein [Rhizorhabdus dicambivorans]
MARRVAAAALLALAACGSPEQKAEKAAVRSDLYYGHRDLYSARVEIKRAIGAQDDVPEYWAKLARIELADGHYLEAYQAYARVVEIDPDNEEATQTMAELSYQAGSFEDADRLADKILKKQPRSLRMLLVKGAVAASRRDVPGARGIAEQMLAIDPGNEGAKILLARVMNMSGERAPAMALLEESIAKDGESVAKLMALLDLYNSREDFPRVARTFARLFTLQPGNAELRLEYAKLLYERGRPDRALGMLARLARRHRHDPAIEQKIVDLWTEVGSDRVDVDGLRRFVTTSGDKQMKIALGHLLLDQKRHAEAEALLRPLIDTGDVTAAKVEADVLYAGALAGLGRGGEAQALVDRVLKFDPANPRALLMQVQVAIATGDLASALRDAQALVRDNPALAEARVALADIYVRRKERVLADASFARALNEVPDSGPMLTAYVAYLRDTQREPMAREVAKRFTRSNPRMLAGWKVRAELCLAADDKTCLVETLQALDQVAGSMKLRRRIEAHSPGFAAAVAAAVAKREGEEKERGAAGQARPSCGTTGAGC